MKKAANTAALGDIVDLVMGQAPSSKDTNFDGRGTPFVKVGEFGELRPVIREWTTNPLRMARRTDVLLCVVGATCGKINLGEECAIGRSVAAIRPHSSKLDQFYLYYFMMTLVERLRSDSVGAAQTVISKEMVEAVQIPLPPLAEQRRIVALLDEAFAGLAVAQANAEKNLQNARALFESHLNEVFSKKGEGWVEKRLGEVCDFRGGGTPSKAVERYWKGKIPWVSPKDMKSEVVSDSIDHISQEAIDGSATSLIPKDSVLMVVRSGILARTVPIAITGRDLTINQDLKALCPTGQMHVRFLFHLLDSRMDELLSMVSRGATVHRLMTDQIRSIDIPAPPLAEQRRVVAHLDALSAETRRLAAIYERKLAALAALKKALLHRAFSGAL